VARARVAPRARRGFTLLEAAVAMTIVGLVGAGALGAVAADLRAGARAQRLLPAAAFAQERMAILDLADPHALRMLPDSLAHGTLPKPFEDYSWRATVKEVRGEPTLVELAVQVEWPEGSYALSERRYRPATPAALASR
jgi:prepilin-type N-terminal cleavage/methylation domain-containing protein